MSMELQPELRVRLALAEHAIAFLATRLNMHADLELSAREFLAELKQQGLPGDTTGILQVLQAALKNQAEKH